MTTTAQRCESGTCPTCGAMSVRIVNYRAATARQPWEEGYLAGHWRVGTKRGTNCSGSYGPWVGKVLGR